MTHEFTLQPCKEIVHVKRCGREVTLYPISINGKVFLEGRNLSDASEYNVYDVAGMLRSLLEKTGKCVVKGANLRDDIITFRESWIDKYKSGDQDLKDTNLTDFVNSLPEPLCFSFGRKKWEGGMKRRSVVHFMSCSSIIEGSRNEKLWGLAKTLVRFLPEILESPKVFVEAEKTMGKGLDHRAKFPSDFCCLRILGTSCGKITEETSEPESQIKTAKAFPYSILEDSSVLFLESRGINLLLINGEPAVLASEVSPNKNFSMVTYLFNTRSVNQVRENVRKDRVYGPEDMVFLEGSAHSDFLLMFHPGLAKTLSGYRSQRKRDIVLFTSYFDKKVNKVPNNKKSYYRDLNKSILEVLTEASEALKPKSKIRHKIQDESPVVPQDETEEETLWSTLESVSDLDSQIEKLDGELDKAMNKALEGVISRISAQLEADEWMYNTVVRLCMVDEKFSSNVNSDTPRKRVIHHIEKIDCIIVKNLLASLLIGIEQKNREGKSKK